MVKARGKEPIALTEPYCFNGYGYTTKNGVAFKEIYGDCGEPGVLHYVSLTSEGAEVKILENYVEHVETTDELLVYHGKYLKIFDGEKAVTVDTEVNEFRVTPDERKILYWKRNGGVYVAKAATEPEPELIFDIKEGIYPPDTYPIYCSSDLKQIVFKGGDDLYGYKNGKCKVISSGISQATVVRNTIYYNKGKKIYSYRNGKERFIDDITFMDRHRNCDGEWNLYDDTQAYYSKCFKKDNFAIYIKRENSNYRHYGLMGTDKPYDCDHIVCDGNYVYADLSDKGIVRYNVTTKGFKCKKKLVSRDTGTFVVGNNKIITENYWGAYLITGGKRRKITRTNNNKAYATEGNVVCWLSENNTLYCNNKKLCENVDYFKLRKDGSIAWLTERKEVYVKYKHCKPELVGESRSRRLYTMR